MSRNSYNNIKKYAAFIFMVFTVLSGSSDGFDADSLVRTGKKAVMDILVLNRFFLQDSKATANQLHAGSYASENEGIRSFLDKNAEAPSLNYFQGYTALLIISVFFVNDFILKNNIWKSAVF